MIGKRSQASSGHSIGILCKSALLREVRDSEGDGL